MKQGPTGRFEEYITLRQEILELHAFCRQILYWTVLLVIVGLGWYIGKPANSSTNPGVSGGEVAILLLLAMLLSFFIHFYYIISIERASVYLAVFWESSDSERGLKWNRFIREGAVGPRILPHTVMGVYALSALIVAFYPLIKEGGNVPIALAIALAFFDILVFVILTYLWRSIGNGFRERWLEIKESQTYQEDIHKLYEKIPKEA